MDGVLVDSERFYQQRREAFLKMKGMPIPDRTLLVGANDQRVWELMVPQDENLRAVLKEEYQSFRRKHPVPYDKLANPQAKPLFTDLKNRGLKIAIASSSAKWMIQRMARMLDIADLVDYMISGMDCSAHKPDPEIYLRAMEALGVMAGEAAAVEDSPVGIQAALGAGLRVYALRPMGDTVLDQRAATAVLDQLIDLLAYIGPSR